MIMEVQGTLGSGKTILLCYLAYSAHRRGIKVYSNFSVGQPAFNHPFELVTDIKKARKGSVFIDDIISWFDSRQAIKNYKVTWFYQRSRKYGLDIYYSSQSATGADLRLREITNVVVACEEEEYPVFKLDFIAPNGTVLGTTYIKYSEKIGDLYNTYEVVEQVIRKEELLKLSRDSRNASIFSHMCNVRYNIPLAVGRVLHEMLIAEDPNVNELLESYGYNLKGVVS